MSITTLTSSDFDQWAGVWRQYLAFYQTELPESQYKDTFSRIVEPDGNLEAFILKDETGKIIGLSHYLYHQSSWTSTPVCYLNDLFVDPEIRGKGYGRKLIEATADAAQKKGCGRLYWATKEDNTTARRLYDSVAKYEFVMYRMPLPTDQIC
ncbi:putative acetyltransferase [Thozetella sp. PMI_491]|nr:putative acetyltransferase [Thozetella sp. PMI_491]